MALGKVELNVKSDAMTFFGVCTLAEGVAKAFGSTGIGEGVSTFVGKTIFPTFDLHDSTGVIDDVKDLTTSVQEKRSWQEIGKQVAFVAVGVLLTTKVVVLKLGIAKDWLKVNAPRFTTFITSKAFPRVLCVVRVAKRAWQAWDEYYSTDQKIKDKFWSETGKKVLFSAYDICDKFGSVVPGLAISDLAKGTMMVAAAVLHNVEVGAA